MNQNETHDHRDEEAEIDAIERARERLITARRIDVEGVSARAIDRYIAELKILDGAPNGETLSAFEQAEANAVLRTQNNLRTRRRIDVTTVAAKAMAAYDAERRRDVAAEPITPSVVHEPAYFAAMAAAAPRVTESMLRQIADTADAKDWSEVGRDFGVGVASAVVAMWFLLWMTVLRWTSPESQLWRDVWRFLRDIKSTLWERAVLAPLAALLAVILIGFLIVFRNPKVWARATHWVGASGAGLILAIVGSLLYINTHLSQVETLGRIQMTDLSIGSMADWYRTGSFMAEPRAQFASMALSVKRRGATGVFYKMPVLDRDSSLEAEVQPLLTTVNVMWRGEIVDSGTIVAGLVSAIDEHHLTIRQGANQKLTFDLPENIRVKSDAKFVVVERDASGMVRRVCDYSDLLRQAEVHFQKYPTLKAALLE